LSAQLPLVRLPVGVVVERRKAASPWIEHVWRPVAVLAGIPEAAPWTEISTAPDAARFFAGSVDIELHRSETAHYRDNLDSGAPALWVVLRPTGREPPFELKTVTADPAEGEGFSEPGTDLVEQVAMPESIRRAVAAFIAEHPAEHSFAKRERDRADPEALGRRVPARKGRHS
jgi:hypothetical protein